MSLDDFVGPSFGGIYVGSQNQGYPAMPWWIGQQQFVPPSPEEVYGMAQAQVAALDRVEKLRQDYVGLDDDALRFRLGEESLAFTALMNANIANRSPEQLAEMRRQDNARSDRMAAIRAEMHRRGIYDPQYDYTWAVTQKWREEEAARNAERVAKISKWLPWRQPAREKDYGI